MENREIFQKIAGTGASIALVVGVQWISELTEPFAGPYISEICVNALIVLLSLTCSLWSAAAAAVLSPFCAYVLRMGPGLWQIVPAVAFGNAVMAAGVFFLHNLPKLTRPKRYLGILAVVTARFLVLYCAVICVLIPVMGPALPAGQAAAFRRLYSWPQWVTGFGGCVLGFLLAALMGKLKKK